METILDMSYLIKKGLYPWGSSKVIWIPKPGVKDKLRPITIPNFGYKIVVSEESIRMVLEAIYEPVDASRTKIVVLASVPATAYTTVLPKCQMIVTH